MIVKNLAEKTNQFEEIDKEYAYLIFLIEKEFHVGMIDDKFPAMKFWNLVDEYNLRRYNESQQPSEKGGALTFR